MPFKITLLKLESVTLGLLLSMGLDNHNKSAPIADMNYLIIIPIVIGNGA